MALIEIQAFVRIVRAGSFTAAAGELGISQPAVSRRIEMLETELGQPLFDRMPSGARLTAAGEAFLPHARQVLAAIRDGAAAVAALASGSRGSISLALVGTLASTSLTAKLSAFRDAHPDVRMHLRTARSFEVSALVQQGDVMLGLRYFEDASPSIESVEVARERLVIACAANHELAARTRIGPADLRGTAWIGFPPGSRSSGEPFARELRHTLSRARQDDAEIIAIDSLTAQKRLIEAGFGIGLVPISSIDEELRMGTLTVLDVEELRASVPVVAIFRREGFLSPAAKELLGVLAPDAAEGD